MAVSAERLLIGASNVTAQIGGGSAGVAVQNGELALLVQKRPDASTGYALQVSGQAALSGFGGSVSLSAGAQLRVNAMGESVAVTVPTGVSSSATLRFDDGLARQELLITNGRVDVNGLGHVQGDLKLITTRQLINGVVTTDLSIGFENAGGTLTLGGASASLSSGSGALLLRHEVDGSGAITRKVALQADGTVALQAPGLSLNSALKISYNRWGQDLDLAVATPSADYAVRLLSDETRLSGQAELTLASTLTVSGQLSIESRLGQTVTLSNGTQVQVDQLVIGGAQVSAALRSGADSIATLGGIDIAAVVSTEAVNTGARRWITSSASLGTVSVAGYSLQDLQAAQLSINRAYDAVSGRLIDAAQHASNAAQAVIDWSGNAQTLTLSASKSLVLAQALPRFEIPVSGSIDIGGAFVTGQFKITLEQSGADRIWTVDAQGASVGLRSGGAYVGIENASGTLTLGPGNTRSGSLSGTAVMEGLAGLAVSGTFTTSFLGSGLNLSGTGMTLSVAGFGQISGNLTVSRSNTGQILLAATGVNASFGAGGAGVSVSNANLGLYIAGQTESSAGYALVADGQASLDGFAGVSMSANASVRINTLGQTLSTQIGGVQIEFTDRQRIQEVVVTSGSLSVAGLGTVSGALAVTSRTSVNASQQNVTDLQIGLAGVSGNLSLGALSASLSQGAGAIVLRKVGTAAGTHAVQLEGNVVLAGSGVNLTANRMRVAYNRMGGAIDGLQVSTGSGSYSVSLLDNETRVSGQASASVAGLELSGEVFLEVKTGVSQALAGGGTVTLEQTILGGTGLALRYASGGSTLAQFGNADLAMVFSKNAADASQRWLTALGHLGSIEVMGQSLADLRSAQLRLNQAIDAAGNLIEDNSRAVLDWAGNQAQSIALSAIDQGKQALINMADRRWEIPVEGAIDFGAARLAGNFKIVLDKDASSGNRIWDIQASGVEVALSAGGASVALQGGSGSLYLNGSQRSGSISGTAAISGLAGLSLQGNLSADFDAQGLRLAGNNVSVAVDGFGSLSGNFAVNKDTNGSALLIGLNQVQADFGGITISGGQLGLYTGRNALGEAGYALVAQGSASVSGLSGLSLNATASVRVNTLGEALSRSITVGGQALALEFNSGLAVQELLIRQGAITIDGLGAVSGDLGIQAQTVRSGSTTTSTLRIGLSGLSGNLTPGGVGASLRGGNGALLIEKISTGASSTSRYALQVGGSLGLTGIDGVTLQADDLVIAYNRMGRAIDNEVIANGSGEVLMSLLDNETRIRGRMTVEVAGALSVSGDMFIETRSDANAATVTLTDGSSVSVNQLIFGGAGIQAALGSSSVGASLSDVDVAVVLSTERNAGSSSRRWLSAQALVGGATVQGYALADLQSAQLQLNSELQAGTLLLAGTRAVIDWNGPANNSQTLVAISPDQSLAFNQGQRVFNLDVNGRMALGPASLSGQFAIALESSAQGDKAWRIDASGVDLGLQANGARVGLSNGSGQLWLGKDNSSGLYGASQRSGSITGTAAVTGVSELTLSGTFAARFDSQGNLELAGAVDLDIAGYARASGQFAVTQTALQTASPQTLNAQQVLGASASISEIEQGGLQSASQFSLNVAEGSGNSLRVREGLYTFGWNSASAQVRLLASDSDAAWSAKLQTAMNALFGAGNASVTGSVANGFVIRMTGTRLGQTVSGLSMTAPVDPSLRDDWGSNYLVSQASSSAGAVHALDLMPAGPAGTIAFGFDFQARSNTIMSLAAYDSASGRFREGSYQLSFGGQTVSVSTLSASGSALSDAQWASRLQTALGSLFGQDTVRVSGSRSAGFAIEFVGAWAGQAIAVDSAAGGSGLFLRAPTDAAAQLASSDQSQVISQAVAAAVPTAYTLNVQLPAGGVSVNAERFALQFANNPKLANIPFVNLQDSQGRHIIDALMVLTGSTAAYSTKLLNATSDGQAQKVYQSADITVRQLRSPGNSQLYEVSFTGAVASKVAAWGALSATNTGATAGIAYVLGGKVGAGTTTATGAVHTLSRWDAAQRGTFTLSLTVAGTRYTTGAINMQASGVALEAALLLARSGSGATLASTGVSVTGSINSQGLWQVAFGGAALGQPIAPMTRTVSAQLAPAASLTMQTTGLSTAAGQYTTAAIDFAQFNDSSAQGAQALRQALLDARTADGRSFADSGVSVSTSYDAAARQWRVSLGAAAVGQNFAPFQGQVTPRAAAEARLQQTATGQTSNEWQRLQINQAGAFQLGFNGRYTSVLQSQGLSAGALQAALQALPGVGTGGVSVSAASGGGWDIRFGGSLAGRNLSALQVQAVRTLDLRLDSGTWADAVRLRLAGQADWARTIERVSGSTDAAWQATLASELQAALQALPGIGRGNVQLQAIDGAAGTFYVVASGGLTGKALPALEVQLLKAVAAPENYLHVGASGASIAVGTSGAGLQVQQAELGLVISRSTPVASASSSTDITRAPRRSLRANTSSWMS